MRRREFLGFVGSAAVAWPLAAQAQQATPMRRVGVFLYFKEEDLILNAYFAAFQKQLLALGWSVGKNLQIDYKWTGDSADLVRKHAAELVALKPDVILAEGGSNVGPLQQVTRTVAIVFVEVADAVGGGFVQSLSHPGGNATGYQRQVVGTA
jgi:putative ABC transport system substrate-binding protein